MLFVILLFSLLIIGGIIFLVKYSEEQKWKKTPCSHCKHLKSFDGDYYNCNIRYSTFCKAPKYCSKFEERNKNESVSQN